MVLLKMMLLNLAGPLHELSFNKSHCIQLENKVMTRGMYICEYVSLFRLLAVCNIYIYIYIYIHTRARARERIRVVPSFGLLVFGIFPRRVQEMVEHLLNLLSRQTPDSLVSEVVAFCTFVFLCASFNH